MRLTRGRRVPTYRMIYHWLESSGFNKRRKNETWVQWYQRTHNAVFKLKRWK